MLYGISYLPGKDSETVQDIVADEVPDVVPDVVPDERVVFFFFYQQYFTARTP